MQQAGEAEPGAMAAVLALDVERLEAVCADARTTTGRPVQVANDNCPGQVVISGDEQALREAMRRAEAAGARKVVQLPITIAAHSPLMATAAADFAAAVAQTPIKAPEVPVIGNTGARPLTSPAEIREELVAQLTGSVRWTASMRHLLAQGVDTFVEVGPGSVLTGLMKRIERKAERKRFELEE